MVQTYSVSCSTRLEFGVGMFDKVGQAARKVGSHAFVVLDPFLKGSALEARLDAQFDESRMAATKWYDVVPNPRAATCDAAAAVAVKQGCDFVIAVGGGSAIDAAKAIALVAVHGGRAWDYTARAGFAHLDPQSPGLPIMAVPTSAGTGAEVTPFAVLSNPDLKLKATIKNPGCSPVVALIDPALHVTKSPRLTASTGVDTFLHSFEGFMTSQSNGWTETVALRSMQLFAGHIREACANGENLIARAGMAEACYLAGLSLANIGVGIPHSLGQALGALKDTPHGESCAVCLVPTLHWTVPNGQDRLAQVAEILDPGLREQDRSSKAARVPALLSALLSDIGLTGTLGSLGLKPGEVDDLVDVAFANYGRGIARWIKPGDRDSITQIVRDSL